MGCMTITNDPVDCTDPSAYYDANFNIIGNQNAGGGIDTSQATVAPNPQVPSAASASPSSAAALSSLGSTMAQFGATIAGMVTNTPTVVGPTGIRTGAAAVTPGQLLSGSPNGLMLLLVLGVVIILVVSGKK